MPKPVIFHVKPLLQMCLQRLSSQLVQNCSGTKGAHPVGDEGNESVSVKSVVVAANPFEDCPSTLLDRILEKMEYDLNSEHLDLLLNTRVRKLIFHRLFSSSDECDVYRSLQLATVRCPELSILGMKHFCNFPSPETYRELLPRFKHLQVLDVAFSYKFDDSCLEILGIHCRDLRILDINYCYKITDVGIKGLCGGTTDVGKEMRIGQSGQCKSLRQVSITGTMVTLKGVQMILINSPHLYFLEHPSVIQALADMHRPEADNNFVIRPKSYAFIKTSLFEHWHPNWHVPYKTGDLRLVAPLCPLVTDLDIEVQVGVTDADLLSLLELETLSKLRISCVPYGSHRCPITFDGGLAPLLKVRGGSLISLKLRGLPISNLGIIVEYCPNLKLLALERCTYSATARTRPKLMKTKLILNRLEELSIEGNFIFDEALNLFMPTEVFFLSSVPSLKRLSVAHCDNLNDDVIQEICQFHPFTNLQSLYFSGCRFVTKKGIDLFMNEENALKNMRIRFCKLVTDEDFAGWRKKVKENNWDTWVVRM